MCNSRRGPNPRRSSALLEGLKNKMATQSKKAGVGGKAQLKVADMKPQKDAKGGKKLSSKAAKNLLGGGGLSFGPRSTSKGPPVHEN
jgi:hypothetical protein